ncbi:response regulator receiver sensor signal transduction histidine kinase [Arcticibacter svalbardensis MN12-7]|uniref:histidine kinase n=1 Tax=Arcticibacter svalbardensis MN12-7 TaxID=1150600 RepID=R9GX24_9SPHI|nr:hybrid sensor histidine kinase/response regulator [Arcticibacter svalbardensis]EOR96060.1 response regulator receiver sensor signal transduction histidine kinase [Arcticibacter svalbardensis MN12-7]
MILIVDDKPENIFSLKRILEINNFEVDTALSGEEALKKILKRSYSLIILDVQMPGMDGFEVAENISGYSKSKDIPIIFLSAVNTDKRFITKGYASGGVDYITKPVEPEILLLKVKTLHRIYEQTRDLNEAQLALRAEIEFRKEAQTELKERVQELRSILESIPQIAFTAKSNGVIEFVNQHWLNYSTAQEKFPVAHPDDPNIEEKWKDAISRNVPLEMEVRIKNLYEDEYHCHLLRTTPIKEAGVIVKWVGTFTDIEDQKKAEMRKDEFLSIASHELKTPLTSIKAYMQLLERAFSSELKTSKVSANYLQRAQFQVDKLHSLIADLLDISKIESGKLKFNEKVFNFENLLANSIDIIRQTNHEVTIIRKGTVDKFVYGDEIRIEQVILNYLTNAIKYSPDNKEVIVENSLTPEGDIIVRVIDSGIGISSDKHAQIFNKYYRVDETSNRFQGLGIGLYICSEIIKRHHGSFGVDSSPGKGSSFYFSIPVHNTETTLITS